MWTVLFSPLNGAIQSFDQTICPWVVWCTEASCNAKLGTQIQVDLEFELKTYIFISYKVGSLREVSVNNNTIKKSNFSFTLLRNSLPRSVRIRLGAAYLYKKVEYTFCYFLSLFTFKRIYLQPFREVVTINADICVSMSIHFLSTLICQQGPFQLIERALIPYVNQSTKSVVLH